MIEKVIAIAKEAGKILMKYYNMKYDITTKNNDSFDFLTTADKESDEYIRKRLKEEFPKDFILSEETKPEEIDFSGRVWMVDPLDGTKDFIHHGGGFAVMIGLCVDGAPKFGVVYSPVKEILYYAEKGKGAYKESQKGKIRLKVSNMGDLEKSRLVVRATFGEEKPEIRPMDKVVEGLRVKERIPSVSIGMKLGLIASNEADSDVMTNSRGCKWDTCAPQIILEEAGGMITDLDGKPLDYKQSSLKWENFFVSSNKKLHPSLIEEIKKLRK